MAEFYGHGCIISIDDYIISIAVKHVLYFGGKEFDRGTVENNIVKFRFDPSDLNIHDINMFTISKLRTAYTPMRRVYFTGFMYKNYNNHDYTNTYLLKSIGKRVEIGVGKVKSVSDDVLIARDIYGRDIYARNYTLMIPNDSTIKNMREYIHENDYINFQGYEKDNKLIVAMCITFESS